MSLAVTGHLGEWLQGRLGPDGPVVLVTLPCSALGVTARVEPGRFAITEDILTEEVARAFFDALAIAVPSCRIALTANAPVGGGAGISTAALLALAQVAEVDASPDDLAQACLVAEQAADPLMLAAPDTALWASRSAQVVRRFAPLPEFDVVGGFFGPPERTDASDTRFPDISDLVEPWRAAATSGNRATLAGLATEAARRTTSLRGPDNDPTETLAQRAGALGVVRAHTGSARGLVFAPGTVPAATADHLRAAGYAHVIQFRTGSA